jgi:8-oxo-dGTP pyrophosphatase MutT (NUDIX family)
MTSAVAVVPAATVVVARVVPAHQEEAFEVYLVKRAGGSTFMPLVHVFPGGRLETDDDITGIDPFVAAGIRETWEECGVLLARSESGLALSTRAPCDAVMARLAAGEPFAHALAATGLVHDADALVPLGRWITPEGEKRRYDTRFFFAVVPPLQRHDAVADGVEVEDGRWLRPSAALAAYQAGTIRLAPPTLVMLEELARCQNVDDVRAARWPQEPVRPNPCHDDGRSILALPGDPLHEVAQSLWPHRTRVVVDDQGRFRSALVRRSSLPLP